MNGNWYQTNKLVYLSLIVNNNFDIEYFDCVIDYICFVRNYVNSFGLVIYLCSWIYKVFVFLNNLSCLEVVSQSYYYCENFYLVGFDLFSCFDQMICLVPCTFVVYSDYLVDFVCIQ